MDARVDVDTWLQETSSHPCDDGAACFVEEAKHDAMRWAIGWAWLVEAWSADSATVEQSLNFEMQKQVIFRLCNAAFFESAAGDDDENESDLVSVVRSSVDSGTLDRVIVCGVADKAMPTTLLSLLARLCSVTPLLCRFLSVREECAFGSSLVGSLLRPAHCEVGNACRPGLVWCADAAIAAEAWGILDVVLSTNPVVTTGFIRTHFSAFVDAFVCCLVAPKTAGTPRGCHDDDDSKHFYRKWGALKQLTTLLGKPCFGKARTLLAESPALLCALLRLVQQHGFRSLPRASFHIRFEVYHCLKVFIAKQSKPTPIGYLLWLNRDALCVFVTQIRDELSGAERAPPGATSGKAAGEREGNTSSSSAELHAEVDMLLHRIHEMEPLSREELALVNGVMERGGEANV